MSNNLEFDAETQRREAWVRAWVTVAALGVAPISATNYADKMLEAFDKQFGPPLCELSPAELLRKFSLTLSCRIFYYADLESWLLNIFYANKAVDFIQVMLNIEGVLELGDSAYQTPYPCSKGY